LGKDTPHPSLNSIASSLVRVLGLLYQKTSRSPT
jgi:hypothetical protein